MEMSHSIKEMQILRSNKALQESRCFANSELWDLWIFDNCGYAAVCVSMRASFVPWNAADSLCWFNEYQYYLNLSISLARLLIRSFALLSCYD